MLRACPAQLQDELQTAIAEVEAALLALKKDRLLSAGSLPAQPAGPAYAVGSQHRHAHAFKEGVTGVSEGQVPGLRVGQRLFWCAQDQAARL